MSSVKLTRRLSLSPLFVSVGFVSFCLLLLLPDLGVLVCGVEEDDFFLFFVPMILLVCQYINMMCIMLVRTLCQSDTINKYTVKCNVISVLYKDRPPASKRHDINSTLATATNKLLAKRVRGLMFVRGYLYEIRIERK